MKKIVGLVMAVVLLVSLMPASLAENSTEYIPAPYTIEDTSVGPTEYLEPVFYQNDDGPTIGVTLVGVIQEDGRYFKDSDNDGELDVFEDWRLDAETRVADLLTKLTLEQRIGMLSNQLTTTPRALTIADAIDENGDVILGQLVLVSEDPYNSVIDNVSADTSKGFSGMAEVASAAESLRPNSTGEMLTWENRSGVLRATTDVEIGALWTNAVNMVAEYAAVAKDEPTIPFTIISNPQRVISLPSSQGVAAAVMGDVANGGDYSLVERYASIDGKLWDAKGISRMYGPQIDLITDPRWNRNSGTYTEVPEVMAGISTALVLGYQNGTDGAQDGDVALIMKHFPGDGAAYNGFESHNPIGEWRVYSTEGSLENYHLVGFQAAIDAGLMGIMPGYSRPIADGKYGNAPQSYRGVAIENEEIANSYNYTILTTLLRDTMGFKGFVNTDSGILTSGMQFGAEENTEAERVAMNVNAGSDVIGNYHTGVNYTIFYEAYEQGLIEPEALDRANGQHLTTVINMGQFENPYKDRVESKATVDGLADDIAALSTEMHQKSVVLMKNHDNVLPLQESGKNVYVASFTDKGSVEETEDNWKAAFEAAGYTIVKSADEADIAYLDVVPGGVSNSNNIMNVLDLVDGLEVEERSYPFSADKSGTTKEHTSLQDVDKIASISETVHANGGIVIASIRISSPWILTNLEPYCDALIGQFTTSIAAQMDVLTGAYNPTGKLPVTMVSCNEVIAVNEQEIDGVVYEICVSPNDVPGYAKDEYMSEDVLAQSPSGSYAYMDADGNLYAAWFGLSY
ncbi:MAG: glycoside hydrolase family 3 N-terminal domain-containing protein [Christensenellales bacterium]|jgi:beta-glucosidase